jgi:hypothetical protein
VFPEVSANQIVIRSPGLIQLRSHYFRSGTFATIVIAGQSVSGVKCGPEVQYL